MSIVEILYYLTIRPLELFFEVVYMMAYRIIGSPSLAIIALSLAMNFLVLPLYRRADAMQEEERRTEERLGVGVAHIKKVFQGDERMMILQTYYRQNHYKQSYVLRGSLPLLLEVPFFIAAYRFLSSLQLLHEVSFGPIADLGAPDALLVIGGITINVLPILMTLVNIISSSIYADHMSRKTKIQLYVMAAIFLVFLYQSPSGLVFYWTLNNLFSLVKNIFYKLQNPRKVLRGLAMTVGVVAAAYFGVIYETPSTLRRLVLVGGSALLILIPLAQIMLARNVTHRTNSKDTRNAISSNSVFASAVIYLTILVGGLIPSAVIASSPQDFVSYGTFYDPMGSVAAAFVLAAGVLLVWCGLFYMLAGDRRRTQMAWMAVIASVIATVDYMVFHPESSSGTMSSTLVYEHGLNVNSRLALVGLAIGCLIIVFVWLTRRHLGLVWRSVVQVMCIGITVMTILNVVSIRQDIDALLSRKDYTDTHYEQPELTLSKTGQNVIVIMLDRAVGSYLPSMLAEDPELEEQLDGFTYYPNTLSYGGHTIFGAPALFGGYEYTPEAINKRTDQSLVDKHDEALLVMPVLFSEAGYDVTVCDPPYARYSWVSDLTLYDDYPEITAMRTEGKMNPYQEEQEQERVKTRKRNLFCYSVVRCMPLVLQKALYNEGQYNAAPAGTDSEYTETYVEESSSVAHGYNSTFMDSFSVLQNLSEMTNVSDDSETPGTYLFMDNDAVHDPSLLDETTYLPSVAVDNTEYDATHTERFEVTDDTMVMGTNEQMRHYESMMAAMQQLGDWFDTLREMGVYDNTRIILVSDHASGLGSFPERILSDGTDTMTYNPLLMVKDYNAAGFKTSEEFMTNADVAYLSVNGVIENPTNPFTGNEITNEAKGNPQYVLESGAIDIDKNTGSQFEAGMWLTVSGDVRDADNWTIVSEKAVLPNGDES